MTFIKPLLVTIACPCFLMGLFNSSMALEQQNVLHNTFVVVSEEIESTVDIIQTGFYNRSAIIQLGNNKFTTVKQRGQYNRSMIIQIGKSAFDIQDIDVFQGGETDAINFKYSIQTSVNPNLNSQIGYKFSLLNANDAKIIAENFIYAPESLRIGVENLNNISYHTVSVIQGYLEQNYFRPCSDDTCNVPSLFVISGYEQVKKDDVLGKLGYRQNTLSLTLGGKVRMSPIMEGGGALIVNDAESEVEKERFGLLEARGHHLVGFISLSQLNYYMHGIATLGSYDLSSYRFSEQNKVNSDIDGWTYKGLIQLGYLFGKRHAQYISPFLSVGYSNSSTSGYSEEGNDLLIQKVSRQKYKNLVASIGGILGQSNRIKGFRLDSYLKLEMEREFLLDNPDALLSHFNFSPEQTIVTPLQQREDNFYGRISAVIKIIVTKNIDFSILGGRLFGKQDRRQYQLSGQLSARF